MTITEIDNLPDMRDLALSQLDLFKAPFVVRGGFENDSLFKTMAFEGLVSAYGNDQLTVQASITEDGTEIISLRDYVRRIRSGDRIASWSWQPHMKHHDLLKEPSVIDKFDCFFKTDDDVFLSLLCPWVLISHVETQTVLHQDYLGVHGLIGQIEGRKRFGLAAPHVDLRDGEFYADDSRLDYVEISPGDLLYFPSEYWHQAETLETSVSYVGNVVNRLNIDHFMSRACKEMPEFVQRVFSSHVARERVGEGIKWQSKGFRVLAA